MSKIDALFTDSRFCRVVLKRGFPPEARGDAPVEDIKDRLAEALKVGHGAVRHGKARLGTARHRRSSTDGLAEIIRTKGG